MRWRVAVAATIGITSGILCWYLVRRFHEDAADFRWALHLAHRLVAGQSPYDTPLEQYPVTAALFALPFLRLPPEAAAGFFWGISSFLLAFGITRDGYHRLLIFLAYPYWAGMFVVRGSVIIAGSALIPLLLPLTLAKPQVGLPVFLTRVTRRGVIACVVWVILSLIWKPSWPILWIHQWGNYEHYVPLLVLPGPLLLLALVRYRDRDALQLLLTAIMPQRWFFDSFTLWLIPKTRKEILVTIFFSWGAEIWRWNPNPHSFNSVGRGAVLCIYLPMLAVLLWRGKGNRPPLNHAPVNHALNDSAKS
jgi:hypothetical protein